MKWSFPALKERAQRIFSRCSGTMLLVYKERSDKSFVFFSKRGFDQSFNGAFKMLIRSRDACGLVSGELFLNVIAKEFDDILDLSGS
ncbi:MAG: hypothetical protein LBD15_03740 [Holosporales bacterium]|jgi:hypothetical protein|nr:hypothetical protein [Holosporales bacterium]